MQRFDDQEPFVNDDPVETLGVLAELDTIGNELNMFQAENPAPSYYLHAALIEVLFPFSLLYTFELNCYALTLLCKCSWSALSFSVRA